MYRPRWAPWPGRALSQSTKMKLSKRLGLPNSMFPFSEWSTSGARVAERSYFGRLHEEWYAIIKLVCFFRSENHDRDETCPRGTVDQHIWNITKENGLALTKPSSLTESTPLKSLASTLFTASQEISSTKIVPYSPCISLAPCALCRLCGYAFRSYTNH